MVAVPEFNWRTKTFQLKNGVVIKGGYAGFDEPDPNARDINLYETTLSGDIGIPGDTSDNSYHVVTGSGTDATAVLDGFTITAGNADYSIYSSISAKGAGMYNDSGSPTVTNCTFRGNHAGGSWGVERGGGMYNVNDSNPILTNCTFSGNSAPLGAGMFNCKGSPTLTNCTFSRNSAQGPGPWKGCGGGIHNAYGDPILTNCTFRGNSAENRGGGMSHFDGSPTLINCTFTGNSAGEEGGGMLSEEDDHECCPILINCTFSGNSAPLGAGMYNGRSSKATLTNCIFWGDRPEEIYVDYGITLITYSDVHSGWPGEGNIDADPCFVEPGYWDANGVWIEGDYHLLPDSPCIDAGDPDYIAEPNETDLDGKPRIINGRIDMGAYEYSPPITAEARIIPRTINLASKGKSITCYIWLSQEYNVADIDPNTVLLDGTVGAEHIRADEQQQVATARFSREDVQSILDIGEVELTITGQLNNGIVFYATDVIRVIGKGRKE